MATLAIKTNPLAELRLMNQHLEDKDLTQRPFRYEPCEQESLHNCGRIQSHGIFLGITHRDFKIRYLSAKIAPFYEGPPQDLFDRSLSDLVLDPATLKQLFKLKENSSTFFRGLFQGKSGTNFDVLAHDLGHNMLFLECFLQPTVYSIPEIYWTSIFDMSEAEIYDCLFSHLDHLLDYHRALIYKFEPDGSGVVIKEHIKSTTLPESNRYLGLHYPATDIPKTVRDIYLKNPIRYIANINEKDSPILEAPSGPAALNLDLTNLITRGVSPYHVNYLRNMGIAGSCSCAIVLQNKLWGLLSIHQIEPSIIPYETLEAIGQLTKTLTEFLRSKSISEQIQFFEDEFPKTKAWFQQFYYQEIPKPLFLSSPLAEYFNAQGFGFYNGESWTLEGETPAPEIMTDLANKISEEKLWGVFQTNCLIAEHHEMVAKMPNISGITVAWCRSPTTKSRYFLIWLKKEITTLVTWGSQTHFPKNPTDPVDFTQASPQTSFGQWRESMSHHSELWSKESQFVARNLLNQLMQF